MRMMIAAVGRLKAGPDRVLVERYVERAVQAGRSQGLTLSVREFSEGKSAQPGPRMKEEADAILAALPADAALVVLDERGSELSSADFAARIGAFRDRGTRDLVFAIGGADGHDASIRGRADLLVAFGRMTWPHQIVRLMLAEQVYRAITILSGHPYHRA